jgi:hypothetical protein
MVLHTSYKTKFIQILRPWFFILRLIPSFLSTTSLQIYNGFMYATARARTVDSHSLLLTDRSFVEIASGWHVSPCDRDAQTVCYQHPFQSKWLTLDGGIIGTAANDLDETYVRYKGVVHHNSGGKVIEGTRVQSGSDYSDVLLRKRA